MYKRQLRTGDVGYIISGIKTSKEVKVGDTITHVARPDVYKRQGVFGGLDSGSTEATTDVFIESAYFHPTGVRKTARRHGLNTDCLLYTSVRTDNHFYSGYCRTGADGRNYSEESFSFFVSGTGGVPAVDYNELLDVYKRQIRINAGSFRQYAPSSSRILDQRSDQTPGK